MTKVAVKSQEFLVPMTPFFFMESLESLAVPVVSIGDYVSLNVIHRVIGSCRKGRRRERGSLGNRGEGFVRNVVEGLAMTKSAVLRQELEAIIQVIATVKAGSRAVAPAAAGTVETRHTPPARLATVRQDTVVLFSRKLLMMLLLRMMVRFGERDTIGDGQGRKRVHVLGLGALRKDGKVKVRKGQEQAISPGVVHGVQACIGGLAVPTIRILNGVGNGHDIAGREENNRWVSRTKGEKQGGGLCGDLILPCWLQ
jgi:hypothetical protein